MFSFRAISKLILILCVTSSLSVQEVFSEDNWVVGDIRIGGLQRVSPGSIFSIMPVSVGDSVTQYDLQNVAKTLFKTGQFDDIQIGKEGNTLIISLVERTSIAAIELEGNKAIKSEDLLKGLKQAGLSQGKVFKRSILNGLALEIQSQYIENLCTTINGGNTI